MSYSLGGTDLSEFGFVAGEQSGSNIGLSGMLDMPARVGKTFHEWAEGNGVQPYVDQSEIRFAGRDLKLLGYITGADRHDCLLRSKQLTGFIDGFTGLVPLVCEWGTFNVKVSAVKCTMLHETVLQTEIEMREPVVDLSGTLPTPDGGEFGIDNYSFSQLGGFLTKFNGERYGRPGTKEEKFTAWVHEGYQITSTVSPSLELELFVSASNYPLFEAKIRTLYALLSRNGTRMINVARDQFREFFVTEGFKTTGIYVTESEARGIVSFKAIEVYSDFYFLTDNSGDFITDNNNNRLLIK